MGGCVGGSGATSRQGTDSGPSNGRRSLTRHELAPAPQGVQTGGVVGRSAHMQTGPLGKAPLAAPPLTFSTLTATGCTPLRSALYTRPNPPWPSSQRLPSGRRENSISAAARGGAHSRSPAAWATLVGARSINSTGSTAGPAASRAVCLGAALSGRAISEACTGLGQQEAASSTPLSEPEAASRRRAQAASTAAQPAAQRKPE